jgi:PE family protein
VPFGPLVTTRPEMLSAAAGKLLGIGSAIAVQNAAAAGPTGGVVPAAADEVSTLTRRSSLRTEAGTRRLLPKLRRFTRCS